MSAGEYRRPRASHELNGIAGTAVVNLSTRCIFYGVLEQSEFFYSPGYSQYFEAKTVLLKTVL